MGPQWVLQKISERMAEFFWTVVAVFCNWSECIQDFIDTLRNFSIKPCMLQLCESSYSSGELTAFIYHCINAQLSESFFRMNAQMITGFFDCNLETSWMSNTETMYQGR
ncbi:hypothetical protein BMF29_08040 [Comamonas kerstersii]|uniref:Uncharacterized protein n=1 Tax=Comamonas kerstersii TaxID=225992 RepID=A0A0W7Z2Y5_9BURK|nr:hypothetical protein AS359_08645 [Comamonas kerstersii]OOH85387.1 hypothetical protein BMF38_13515 [Comamonas kerstersii]OOH92493.1 hypothetical protein BMF29_08040 [Comamonas kerstersii]